jgi:hypothetical protein
VAVNGDYYLLSSANTTGHPQIINRPFGMEISNGMIGQTPFQWINGFVIRNNKAVYGPVAFSGTAKAGTQTIPLAEVNGYAGEGQLVLFNELSNSYGTSDNAHAWSPYPSTMVSLSQPQGGWRMNSPMTFTVTGITPNTTAKNFNGEGAILVGNSAISPDQTLTIDSNPNGPNDMTWENKGAYYDISTTGGDPYFYTNTFNPSISGATAATFTFEYQSTANISNFEIFYGKPVASAGVSTTGLRIENTGLDADDESTWRTFTIDLKPAIDNYNWGYTDHALRLDFGNSTGRHIYIRNMHITGSSSSDVDSKVFLDNLTVGQQVSLNLNVSLYGVPQTDPYINVIGFQTPVLQNGGPVYIASSKEPRTVVGYSRDEQRVYLVVADGRSSASGGATFEQMSYILKALGAYQAVNLDGGGSSCMVVNGTVTNTPSDGSPRSVANGLIVTKK